MWTSITSTGSMPLLFHLIRCEAALWETVGFLIKFSHRRSLCPDQGVEVVGDILRPLAVQNVGLGIETASGLSKDKAHDAGCEAVVVFHRAVGHVDMR